MLIDLHSHEKTYSPDSFQSLDEMTRTAAERGLDGICITDHDTQELAGHIGWQTRMNGVRVFVGCEVFTLEGDILVFGAPVLPKERVDIVTLSEIVRAQNGVMIAAHPYRHNLRGLAENLFRYGHLLDGIEAYNGSTFPDDNERARKAAQQLGITMTGAGDSHHIGAIGRFATHFTGIIETVKGEK